VVAFGAARYQASVPVLSPASLAYYNDTKQTQIIEGMVVRPSDIRDSRTDLIVKVDRLRTTHEMDFKNVGGLLLAQVPPDENWHYGDRVRIRGELRTPFVTEEFSYRDYLAHRGILSILESQQTTLIERGMGNPLLNAIYSLRERAFNTIYSLYPDPEASLLRGSCSAWRAAFLIR
jgi:competence protein ComEC